MAAGGLRSAGPDIVCDGQPMIRERLVDEATAMEDDDAQYVYDLYTAVDEDTEDENGRHLPTVGAVMPPHVADTAVPAAVYLPF